MAAQNREEDCTKSLELADNIVLNEEAYILDKDELEELDEQLNNLMINLPTTPLRITEAYNQ